MKVAEPQNPADLATRAKTAAPPTVEPSVVNPDPNPNPGAESPDNASGIAATLMQQAPEVQPAAIAEHRNQAKAEALKDAKGVTFDESIHVRGPDGKPTKTAGGEWAKRRGRKAGTASKPGNLAGSVLASPGAALADPGQQARTAGAQAAALYVSLGMMLGGEEWMPVQIPDKGIDEMAFLQKLFGDYFVATNRKDIPPGAALAFGLLAYTLPRFFKPTTRQRLGAAKDWTADKIRRVYVWWRGRKGK